MHLQGVECFTDGSRDRVKIVGNVRYDADGFEEDLWFEVPASCRNQVSRTGNPWLAALLPLAVTKREPLRLSLPVDPVLLEHCRTLLGVWAGWYPARSPIPIEAPAAGSTNGAGPERGTGLFFSGGVDSFHSLIRRNGPASTSPFRVTDLLTLHGADIPLADGESFARLYPRIQDVAKEFGTEVIHIATNLRQTRWWDVDWGHLGHGALLAASGLMLESRFSRLLIASSARRDRLMPWGSHPDTDPLYSTSRLSVEHDGADVERPEKLAAIASHRAVHRHLRVCWIGRTDTNCGRCPKCFHTMVGLELAGALGKSETLPRAINPAAFEKLYLERRGTYTAYNMVKLYRLRAKAAGRKDLVGLMNRIIGRSDRKRYLKRGIEGLAKARLIPMEWRNAMLKRLFSGSVKY